MKLSVIIPSYNVESWIKTSLNSLIIQELLDVEIIVVDDGSSDDTCTVAQRILSDSGFINYKVITQENKGVSAARNTGLLKAKGDYVLFLDADDYVSDTFVNDITKTIDECNADIICWGYNDVSETNHSIIRNYFDYYDKSIREMNSMEALENILVNNKLWIWTGSAVYNRKFLIKHELYYYEGCTNGEDQEFSLKAILNADNILFVNKILSNYVQRRGSISNSYNLKRFDAVEAMKRTIQYFKAQNKEELGEVIKSLEFKIVNNYLLNLQSCVYSASKKESKYIFKDLNELYPGLKKEIIFYITNYETKLNGDTFKVLLYKLSPKAFVQLIRFYASIKNTLGGE
jgi:glycosyltransferase involved in cell wall biosynthesis